DDSGDDTGDDTAATAEPTAPATEPTAEPTEPTDEPTEPSAEPTEPTAEPTTEPTAEPTGPGSIDPDARAKEVELSDDDLAALDGLASGKLVGIVAATMGTEFHATLNESVKARAEELGFEAEIFDSREDPNLQLQGIESFVSKGAAAIIVTGLGGETIGPVAAEAAAAGACVLQGAGRDLADIGAVTLSVGEFDVANASGVAAGEYAAEHYGEEPIQMVTTAYPSIEALVARADMIQEGFESVYPHAES